MKQRLLSGALCLMLASGAFAQRGGARGGGMGGGFRGGGGLLGSAMGRIGSAALGRIGSAIANHGGFSGGGNRGGFPGGYNRGGFPGGYNKGGFHGGYGKYAGYGYRGGYYGYGGYGYPGFYGSGLYDNWPGYFGSYWGSYWPTAYYSAASYYPSYSYPAYEPSPPVVFNQYYNSQPIPEMAPQMVREYTAPTREYVPPPPPDYEPDVSSGEYRQTMYLIGFRDTAVLPVIAYWVQGQMLHYVTLDRVQHEAPLARIDRDLSMRLNRERRVNFWLP